MEFIGTLSLSVSLSLSLSLSLFLPPSLSPSPSPSPHTHAQHAQLKGDECWTNHKFWSTFPIAKETVGDNCERISYLNVDERAFIERYEQPNVPVVITDSQLDWLANKKWTVEVKLTIENVDPSQNVCQKDI